MSLPAMPPVNVQAEQSVLGTLCTFYTPQSVHIVQAAGLRWSDFTWREHAVIYRAVLRLHREGSMVDGITVRQLMRSHQELTERADVRLTMCEAMAHPASLKEHAKIVHERGQDRRVLEQLYAAEEGCHAQDRPAVRAAIERIQQELAEEAAGELRLVKGQEKAA